jgi:hypothetical protein
MHRDRGKRRVFSALQRPRLRQTDWQERARLMRRLEASGPSLLPMKSDDFEPVTSQPGWTTCRLTADFGRGLDVTNLRKMRYSRFETQRVSFPGGDDSPHAL